MEIQGAPLITVSSYWQFLWNKNRFAKHLSPLVMTKPPLVMAMCSAVFSGVCVLFCGQSLFIQIKLCVGSF